MKYLIDTDIGDDIDDALALGYALKKGLDIVGITTVYREASSRASIVRRLLSGVQKDIPVYVGKSEPLSQNATLFGHLNYGPYGTVEERDPDEAIRFIGECAKKYKEDLCILVIGAQTNVAAAYLRYKEAMDEVGQILIMGGCFNAERNEWNVSEDPLAARIVSESGMNLLYVPIEITERTGIGEENYRRILSFEGEGVSLTVANMVREWKKRNLYQYVPILHDPAALICYLEPALCRYEEIPFVAIDEGPAAGLTLNFSKMDRTLLPPINVKTARVVTQIDEREIVNEFMSTLFS